MSCAFLLTSCGDFAAIFRKNSPNRQRSSKPHKTKPATNNKNKSKTPKLASGFFIWPLHGEVSSGFGNRNGQKHDGIDIRGDEGEEIYASAAGTVVYSGKLSGYGNLVLIKHKQNYFTAYAHNSQNLVKEGDEVSQRKVIALVGNTGNASGYHLHFEVRFDAKPQDPMKFLP